VYDLRREFDLLTQVQLCVFLIEYCFLLILSLNIIKLINN
jgi:hypothetical protein